MTRIGALPLAVAMATGLLLAACASPPPPSQPPAPAVAAPAPAPAAPNIADLQGARAAGGETALMSRGFVSARTQGLTAYWWHAASGTCARTVTANGRYRTVDSVPASSCGR